MKKFRGVFSALLMLTIVLSMFATSVQALSRKDKALLEAAEKGDIKKVEKLIKKGADINVKQDTGKFLIGWTPVMYAAGYGHTNIVELLIEKGADANEALDAGVRYIDIMNLAFEKGADINAKGSGGYTPLMGAVSVFNVDAVKWLLAHGALMTKELIAFQKKTVSDASSPDSLYSMDPEWAKKVVEVDAILKAHKEKVEKVEKEGKAEARREKLKGSFERDKKLPLQTRKDKYLMALKNNLKSSEFEEALIYFDFLERLNIDLPPSFTFFYGEALLRTGQSKPAIDKLYKYIELDGQQGKYYQKALALASEAEGML